MSRPDAAIVSRKAASDGCRARIAHAISVLAHAQQPINVAGVARHAGVSRQTVYQHQDLYAEIVHHQRRQQGQPKTQRTLGPHQAVTTKSLTARLHAANTEITDLRRRLAQTDKALIQALGDAASVAAVDDETTELQRHVAELSDRSEASERRSGSQAETIRHLEEDLAAARTENRRLAAHSAPPRTRALD